MFLFVFFLIPFEELVITLSGASPTSQLLMDYEEHLRNTLEKGLDAESYSLHTFEALLTRSMENLGKSGHESLARATRNICVPHIPSFLTFTHTSLFVLI